MNTTTGFRVPRLCVALLVAAILAGIFGCGGSSNDTVIVTASPTATATPILGSSGAVICNGSPKTTDQFQDLVVNSGVCTIPAGKWVFNNVNIYGTGTCPNKTTCTPGILRFDDVATDFYANSILVENGGSLSRGAGQRQQSQADRHQRRQAHYSPVRQGPGYQRGRNNLPVSHRCQHGSVRHSFGHLE